MFVSISDEYITNYYRMMMRHSIENIGNPNVNPNVKR